MDHLIIINERLTEDLPPKVTADNFHLFDHIGDDEIESDLQDIYKEMAEYIRAKDLADAFPEAVDKDTYDKLRRRMEGIEGQRTLILSIKALREQEKKNKALPTSNPTEE